MSLCFLLGCIIVGGQNGIHFALGHDGRPNGVAFVELASSDDLTLALSKNRNHMGRRYVEGNQTSFYTNCPVHINDVSICLIVFLHQIICCNVNNILSNYD